VCVIGELLGRTFSIGLAPLVFGRGAVDIMLHANEVSRQHARVEIQDGQFVLDDLNSSNGTYVNGTRVVGRVTLRLGDRIQIGSTIFVLVQHDEFQERMQRLERLEAMGGLAGGLAHDFNNALQAIIVELDVIDPAVDPSRHEARVALESIRHAAASAAALAKRLMRLGRTEHAAFEVVPMAHLVELVAGIVRRQPGPRISITTRVAPDLAVIGSPEELHQMMLNLMLNARDAMPRGGDLRIEATNVYFDDQEAMARHLPGSGEFVELVVADSGSGMDEATLARAFEPFFTTKPVSQGTGLGLAMVHGTVRRHGGAIDVESAVGRGTTFRVVLQRAATR
jgi:hypothetical protein